MALVTLCNFRSHQEALFVKSVLESEGVFCALPDHYTCSLHWDLLQGATGSRLMVSDHDLPHIQEIFEDYATLSDTSAKPSNKRHKFAYFLALTLSSGWLAVVPILDLIWHKIQLTNSKT